MVTILGGWQSDFSRNWAREGMEIADGFAEALANGLEQTGIEPGEAAVRSITVQFSTPDAAAFDAALVTVRGTGGVRGLGVTSTAIGGTSVMSVSYAGSLEDLAAALEARGFSVRRGANALAISR